MYRKFLLFLFCITVFAICAVLSYNCVIYALDQSVAESNRQKEVIESRESNNRVEKDINDELIYILDKKKITPIDLIKSDNNASRVDE
jgi:SHS2 domain-containing protein